MESNDIHLEGLAGFRRALRRFLAYSETITGKHGLTAQQYQAMLALKTMPQADVTVTDLAEELLLKHHSAVELTKRMSLAGLITRTRLTENRRKVILALTPQGEITLEELANFHRLELRKHKDLIISSLIKIDRDKS